MEYWNDGIVQEWNDGMMEWWVLIRPIFQYSNIPIFQCCEVSDVDET
jgi:hypothetical protein